MRCKTEQKKGVTCVDVGFGRRYLRVIVALRVSGVSPQGEETNGRTLRSRKRRQTTESGL